MKDDNFPLLKVFEFGRGYLYIVEIINSAIKIYAYGELTYSLKILCEGRNSDYFLISLCDDRDVYYDAYKCFSTYINHGDDYQGRTGNINENGLIFYVN